MFRKRLKNTQVKSDNDEKCSDEIKNLQGTPSRRQLYLVLYLVSLWSPKGKMLI